MRPRRKRFQVGAGLAAICLLAASAAAMPPGRGGSTRRRRPRRPDTSPAAGAIAPDFELVTLEHLLKPGDEKAGKTAETEAAKGDARDARDAKDGKAGDEGEDAGAVKKGHVRLSSFKGDRPVVFVLTSYT